MRRTAVALSALILSASAGLAADDPIAVREALMEANAGAAGLSAAMLKGEMEYNPAVAKAAIQQFHATSMAFGDYFPEDSRDGDTTAAPAIWDEPEAFQEALAKFRQDTDKALEAAGKDGPADLEAFKAAVAPVLQNCGSCHEDFRVKKN